MSLRARVATKCASPASSTRHGFAGRQLSSTEDWRCIASELIEIPEKPLTNDQNQFIIASVWESVAFAEGAGPWSFNGNVSPTELEAAMDSIVQLILDVLDLPGMPVAGGSSRFERGSGNLTREDRAVQDFNEVEMRMVGNLVVTQGDEEHLVIEA